MKCNVKVLSLLLLSLAATCANTKSGIEENGEEVVEKVLNKVVEVITLGIEFIKQVANLTVQNDAKYLAIRNSMEELNLDISNSKLTQYEADIVVALNLASNNYLTMYRLINELCVENTATFEGMEHPSVLNESSPNFREEAKSFLEDEAFFLKSMVENTLEKKETAYKYIEDVRTKLASVSGTLAFTQDSFKQLEEAKKAGLKNEIKKAEEQLNQSCSWYNIFCHWSKGDDDKMARTSKNINEAQLKQIQKFLDNTMDYINWLKNASSALKNATQADEIIITELSGRAGYGKTLLGYLQKHFFPFLATKAEKKIKQFAENLYKAAYNISEICAKFRNRANYKIKRSITEHRNFEQDRLYDCAFGSTKGTLSRHTYSETHSKIKSSSPTLGAKTLEKLAALSMYFKISLEKTNNIVANVESDAVRFLNRQKIIHDTVADLTGQQRNAGNYNDLMAQITHLDSYWDDNLSKLQGLKDEWDSLLNATNGSKPEDVINYEADNKIKEIIFLLDSFRLGMVQKIPYGDGKTTDLSTFASSALAYLGEILQDNFTSPASSKVIHDGSLSVQNKTVSEYKNISRACFLKTDEDYQNMVLKTFSEQQASFQTLTNTTTKNKLFALTVFHELSLKSVGQFGTLLKISTDRFLFELKNLDNFLKVSTLNEMNNVEYIEINNYLEQLTAIWENFMFNLRSRSYNWNRFLAKIQDINETSILNTVDIKVTAVKNLLNDKKLIVVSDVREKILTWSIFTYLEKILVRKL